MQSLFNGNRHLRYYSRLNPSKFETYRYKCRERIVGEIWGLADTNGRPVDTVDTVDHNHLVWVGTLEQTLALVTKRGQKTTYVRLSTKTFSRQGLLRRAFNVLRGHTLYDLGYVGNYVKEVEALDRLTPSPLLSQIMHPEPEPESKLQVFDGCNESQSEAISQIGKKLVLIQGPPGTGKSTTIANGIRHTLPCGSRALVVSERNQAICAIAEKLPNIVIAGNVDILRKKMPHLNHLFLMTMVDAKIPDLVREEEKVKRLKTFQQLLEYASMVSDVYETYKMKAYPLHDLLNHRDEKRFAANYGEGSGVQALQMYWKKLMNRKRYRIEEQILDDASVVVCTISTAHRSLIRALKFHSIYVDEAATVREESMPVLVQMQPKSLILVGDHFQLGPFSHKETRIVSLFERCAKIIRPVMLRHNYRNPKCLVRVMNKLVYGDKLIGCNDTEGHIIWYDNNHEETGSPSKKNEGEAREIVAEYNKIKGTGSIIITSFYGDQVRLIRDLTKLARGDKIVSVDSCQGSEADIIMISCVRNGRTIGFCKDMQRFNVAISRAKRKLLVFGNKDTFLTNRMFKQLESETKAETESMSLLERAQMQLVMERSLREHYP